RCTTVLATIDGKWAQIPLMQAEARGYLDAEDRAEVENAIVFFMCAYATLPRAQRKGVMDIVSGLWSAQTSPLTPMEFASSLPTSSGTGSSGGTGRPATDAQKGLQTDPAPAAGAEKPSQVPY